jgi:DNA-directed RNA polymerase specialized sigma24 family protein
MKATGEHMLRELAPQVLGAVVRRYGDFGAAEDAVQEALTAAALQWPRTGVPDDPRAWLVQVAARRLTDQLRSDSARRRRETKLVLETPEQESVVPPPDEHPGARLPAAQAGAPPRELSARWRRVAASCQLPAKTCRSGRREPPDVAPLAVRRVRRRRHIACKVEGGRRR